MIYKLIDTNQNNVKIYARIDDDGLCRLTCSQDDANFKKEILADEAQLQDADGNTMSAEQAKDYIKELP